MSNQRSPVQIAVQPWFFDHRFGGKSIFPAVETLLLLAARVVEKYPEVDVRVMEEVSFAKFLEVPPESKVLPVLLEADYDEQGRVQAKLLSRIQYKAMSRIKEHGAVFFPGENNRQVHSLDPAPLTDPVTRISAEQLYQDLVPFGPAYHTLKEVLYLSECEAWGSLQAPQFPTPDSIQKIMGSPFPLDGALHAACVLGQQSVDFVPFPVGFFRRVIVRPTQPAGEYITKVRLLSQSKDELCFDIGIFNLDGEEYETVTGVRMRAIGITQ